MAQVKWRMKDQWVKNCGCPCDFNARPTLGHCQGSYEDRRWGVISTASEPIKKSSDRRASSTGVAR